MLAAITSISPPDEAFGTGGQLAALLRVSERTAEPLAKSREALVAGARFELATFRL